MARAQPARSPVHAAAERTSAPGGWGHLLTQATLLLPGFIIAEATLSFVGLGFPDAVPTWGTMLQDASSGPPMAEGPWMLAPGAAIFVLVLGVNLAVRGSATGSVQLDA